MTEALQTVIFATGNAGDHAAMLTQVGPLTPESLVAIAGERFASISQPSFDDDGRWVFAGTESAAPQIMKALSRTFPTLDWYCHLPTDNADESYDYALTAGVGVMERFVPWSESRHRNLPPSDAVVFRYTVGEQSNVLQAVFVVNDGTLTNVTDDYMQRTEIQSFPQPKRSATASLEYDDEDIALLLSQAN